MTAIAMGGAQSARSGRPQRRRYQERMRGSDWKAPGLDVLGLDLTALACVRRSETCCDASPGAG